MAFRNPAHARRILAGALVCLTAGGTGCREGAVQSLKPVPKAAVRAFVITPNDRKPTARQPQVLGNGWYANVEVDSQDNLMLAWVDADIGDVFFARTDKSGAILEKPESVEIRGAVGSYLQLAVAPGDVPVVSYYHQDEQTLRLAHRVKDRAKLKAAGVTIDAEPNPEAEQKKSEAEAFLKKIPGALDRNRTPRMGDGWFGEDVVFGDNVGLAGSMTVGPDGIPHLVFYRKGQSLTYATRKSGAAAFGPGVAGQFVLQTIDKNAGSSYTMSTDVELLPSGKVMVSYCNWNYVDAQLKLAVSRDGKNPDHKFNVLGLPFERAVDGWHSGLVVGPKGVDVYSVATGDAAVFHFTLNPQALAPPGSRDRVFDRPGPLKVAPGNDGVWLLTRGQGAPRLGEPPGVWLLFVKNGQTRPTGRWLLEEGVSNDPWLDLDVLSDGTPVAVWTAADRKSMKVYVHDPSSK